MFAEQRLLWFSGSGLTSLSMLWSITRTEVEKLQSRHSTVLLSYQLLLTYIYRMQQMFAWVVNATVQVSAASDKGGRCSQSFIMPSRFCDGSNFSYHVSRAVEATMHHWQATQMSGLTR